MYNRQSRLAAPSPSSTRWRVPLAATPWRPRWNCVPLTPVLPASPSASPMMYFLLTSASMPPVCTAVAAGKSVQQEKEETSRVWRQFCHLFAFHCCLWCFLLLFIFVFISLILLLALNSHRVSSFIGSFFMKLPLVLKLCWFLTLVVKSLNPFGSRVHFYCEMETQWCPRHCCYG